MAAPRKDPPRWFVPVLFGAMLLAIAGLAGLGALLYDPPQGPITIGERTYVIPPEAVSSLTRHPQPFIRIRPPGKAFEIVHDARANGRRDRTGVPHIFSVNDHGHHDVRYGRDGRSLVLCRRAGSSAGGCGTWINHGGAIWSVLFPETRHGDADEFAREATALLRKYDTRSSRIMP